MLRLQRKEDDNAGLPSADRDGAGPAPDENKTMLERFVRLYESWHAAEPGRSYAQKAAEWRAKRPDSDDAEPSPE